ncbi:metallophosphoesterase [Desulfotalea psychrophila]|uniref:Calcineurin-like phosphoesterase domain-containing protein n=1 Tax=Desulfotalea psychrophila (strain LSv54 / DSM 12343) TaxID=177439 RepID=Q6APX5_DESPS|nr:metallophosphoesterase [Desulfotalea psychrophila]CAG35598.1 hypothetical protein DP0869 [Desulfotalea psychrophila LSv54]
MIKNNSLTILHLSDLQFGKNHRFFQSNISEENFNFSTLQARLQTDLKIVKSKYDLEPDLIVITGDLVEYGQQSEFDQAKVFFNELASFLNVHISNVLIVPGNHDINRKACEAYFAECEADEKKPTLPYKPKWRHFKNFYNSFYSDISRKFDLETPFGCTEYPELKVAVANLNSTVQESHQEKDHYGLIGENQAQKIAEQLAKRKDEGWFNIAAVHHNVVRGAIEDDDNLRDSEMLQRVIGDHIDLILHGHTHRGKMHWWSPQLPVIGTGSASVEKSARPDEVPNQYQLLKFTGLGFTRYCRAFAPDEAKWIPDSRVNDDGVEEHEINFRNVHAAFPESLEQKTNTQNSNNIDTLPKELDGSSDQIPKIFSPTFKFPFTHYCDLPPVVDVWVGRDKQLTSVLSTKSGVVAITGIGGQGKSALAAKCLEQWKLNHPKSFWDWRDCREEGDRFHTQLLGQIERITDGAVGGEELAGAPTIDLVKYLFEIIGDRDCLFVFDNVDQYVNVNENSFVSGVSTFVNESLRGKHNCLILITCRPRITYPNIRFFEIYLDGLLFEDTIDLFNKRGVDIKKTGMLNTLNEVYTLTEGHPLWLNLLAIQISRDEKSSENILEELRNGEADNRARSMLRPIWKGLNVNQQQVLRCMAEIPRPMDSVQIHNCISGKIKTFNRFKRAFKTIKALSLVVKCESDDGNNKYDLHPLVRSFIKTEYATTKERLPYIDPIVCYLRQLIMGSSAKISTETSFDKLRMWSEKAELEIESGLMADAVESLGYVANRLLAMGYSEELFRVGKRIIDDFIINPSHYNEIKEFDELFQVIIEALIEFGHEADARRFLKNYEDFVEEGTALFIGFCSLMTWVEWHLYNYDEAIYWGERGRYLKKQSSIDTSCDCSHNLALALRDSGRYAEAMEYFLMGNSLESLFYADAESERDGSFWGNIGRCLMLQGDYINAIQCLKKSAESLGNDQGANGIKNQGYAAKWIAQCLEECSILDDAYIFYRKAKSIWDQRAPILSHEINVKLKDLEQSKRLNEVLKLGEKDIIRRCSVWLKSDPVPKSGKRVHTTNHSTGLVEARRRACR